MSDSFLNLTGLSKFLNEIKSIFATKEQGEKADTAFSHSQLVHAPSNAERNTIVGIQKNGSDLSINSSTRKVNITFDESEVSHYKLQVSSNIIYRHLGIYSPSSITLSSYKLVGSDKADYVGRFKIDVVRYGTYLTDGSSILTDGKHVLMDSMDSLVSETIYQSSSNEATHLFSIDESALTGIVCSLYSATIADRLLDQIFIPVYTNNIYDYGADISIPELNCLTEITSNVQDQIDNKLPLKTTANDIGAASISHIHNDFVGSTSSSAGTSGFVPASPLNMMNLFLCSNGNWEMPSCTVYTHTVIIADGYDERYLPTQNLEDCAYLLSSSGSIVVENDNVTTSSRILMTYEIEDALTRSAIVSLNTYVTPNNGSFNIAYTLLATANIATSSYDGYRVNFKYIIGKGASS